MKLPEPRSQRDETEMLAIASNARRRREFFIHPGQLPKLDVAGSSPVIPLHLFKYLHAPPNQPLSHLSQSDFNESDCSALKSDHSADDASRLRATDVST